jgi:DNA-binding NarL/FixJ family response regulator
MPITALVVEDDPLTRLMLESTLAGAGLEVVAVGRADEALALVDTRPVQVAVLDVHLGIGPTGLDLAHELRRRQPDLSIVMLTSLVDPRLAGDGVVELPHRARYLPKSAVTSVEMLVGIVRDVLAEAALDEDGGDRPGGPAERWSRARNDGGKGLRALTDAQIATLRLVADGLTNAEIAARRSISERTVEKTLLRMARVLGLAPDASRNQRVHLARVYFRGLDGALDGPDPRLAGDEPASPDEQP